MHSRCGCPFEATLTSKSFEQFWCIEVDTEVIGDRRTLKLLNWCGEATPRWKRIHSYGQKHEMLLPSLCANGYRVN